VSPKRDEESDNEEAEDEVEVERVASVLERERITDLPGEVQKPGASTFKPCERPKDMSLR
jgi:hypothetical protein